MTHDPMKSAAADAAATAAAYSACNTYALGWEAGRRGLDEVGIQLAAAQAVIARMQPVVDAARVVVDTDTGVNLLGRALAALDTVPGDALPPSPVGASAPASGSTPAASSVTSSVSEVEGSRCGPSGIHDTEDPAAGLLAASGIDVKGGE